MRNSKDWKIDLKNKSATHKKGEVVRFKLEKFRLEDGSDIIGVLFDNPLEINSKVPKNFYEDACRLFIDTLKKNSKLY